LADAAAELDRIASSPDDHLRSWAREQRAVDEAIQRGRGRLKFDVQLFGLAPDRVLLHFVRAEWLVGRRRGFAASLWLRGNERLETLTTNLRPASWLHMSEFHGTLAREHFGLILNTFDRHHDGWGEVLVAHGGYESMTLELLEYSARGLQPTGVEYTFGC